MSLYTERHGMRTSIEKTYTVSLEVYTLLYECCKRYFDHLAWKYPNECQDGRGCCGFCEWKFEQDVQFEIPTLFRRNGVLDTPRYIESYYDKTKKAEEFDPFAIFDLIEFTAQNVRDYSKKDYHNFFQHYHLEFKSTRYILQTFINEINSIFSKTGLLYQLTSESIIERVEDISVLSGEIEEKVKTVKENGTKELLSIAIKKHKSPYQEDQKDAVNKIWDALERLKTYYTDLDKKKSAEKIVESMSGGQAEFANLFNEEFLKLSKIGNEFRIRHHETDKIEIQDIRHYDYFFNRCLSLIALAIQYLI